MITNRTILKELQFTIFFVCITITTLAQTYWDVDYNGHPLKKVTTVAYNSEGQPKDSSFYQYYNDGKIKSIRWSFLDTYREEPKWIGGKNVNVYKDDTLNAIINYSPYGDKYDVIVKNWNKIFPLEKHSYIDKKAIKLKKEAFEKYYFQYNDEGRNVLDRYEAGDVRGITEYFYRKGQLQKSISTYSYPDSKDVFESEYEVLKKNEYGWVERKLKQKRDSVEEVISQVRFYEIYTKEELKDPVFGVQANQVGQPEVSLTIKEIMDAFYGNVWSYSSKDPLTERQVNLLKTAIDKFEKDKANSTIDSNSYSPDFFFKTLYSHYLKNDMRDEALKIALREVAFWENKDELLTDVNARLSYFYAQEEDYDKALEYYNKLEIGRAHV